MICVFLSEKKGGYKENILIFSIIYIILQYLTAFDSYRDVKQQKHKNVTERINVAL